MQQPASALEQIDYASPGVEQAPRTRVVVERVGDAVRFIDPPYTEPAFRQRLLSGIAGGTLLSVTVIVLFCRIAGLKGTPLLWVAGAVGVINVVSGVRSWRRLTTHSTVIDIASGFLTITRAGRRDIVIPLGELSGLYALTPRRWIPTRGRTSSLIVCARGTHHKVLEGRDYAEVRWLARTMRVAAGMSIEWEGEPPVRARDDEQLAAEPGDHPIDLTRVPPPPTTAPVRGWRARLGKWSWDAYNEMGWAYGVLLLLAIAGLFVVPRLAGIVAICLQFGVDAYFAQGVRFVPRQGYLLTSGRPLGSTYQFLHIVMTMVCLLLWTTAAFLVVACQDQFLKRLREPWRRRKRARRPTLR